MSPKPKPDHCTLLAAFLGLGLLVKLMSDRHESQNSNLTNCSNIRCLYKKFSQSPSNHFTT